MKKLLIKQAWGGQMQPDFPEKLKEMETTFRANPSSVVSDFEFVSVYFPCWIGDGESARMWDQTYPQSYESYVERLKLLDVYGYPKEVLLQQSEVIDKSIIEKYLDLGVRRFTVRNDENARQIKELCGNEAHVMASVTKCLSPDEIKNDPNLQWYDEICLYFFYNRNVDSIKDLPKKYDYCLMPNIACSPHCKLALIHWFEPNLERQEMKCMRNHGGTNEEMGSVSRAEYDKYFSDMIHTVKIIGREMDAESVLATTKNFLMKHGDTDCYECTLRPFDHFNSEKEFPMIVGKGVL